MSFSEEDKEALGERLDEIQESFDELENLLVSIKQDVKRIAQIALSFFLVMLIGIVGAFFISIMSY
jgi:hypothetical protein